MRRFIGLFFASLTVSLLAQATAVAASRAEVQEAVDRIMTDREWTTRANGHSPPTSSSNGKGLQFARNNRLYTVYYSGTWLKGVIDSKKKPDGTLELVGGTRDIPEAERQLMFLVRPDGVEDIGRFFILTDAGIDGTVNEAFEDTDSSSSPVRSKVLPAAAFSDGTVLCKQDQGLCKPRHMERRAQWQSEYDRSLQDLLAFLRNQ